jgi:hypothetical protein
MRVDKCLDGPNYVICDSVEEYMHYEQHRSNVLQQTCREDMKVENRYYGQTIFLNSIYADV